jgi:hypothetical protein
MATLPDNPSPSELIEYSTDQSLISILTAGIGGFIASLWVGGINIVQTGVSIITNPGDALATVAASLVDALIGLPVDIAEAGAASAVQSLSPGGMFYIGPLTWPIAVATALSGLMVLAWYLSQNATSDALPGTFTDLPLVGTDEEGEGEG